MTAPSELEPATQASLATATITSPNGNSIAPPEPEPDNDLPDEVEMSLFDHLEELRQRIFYALIAVVVGVVGCFAMSILLFTC